MPIIFWLFKTGSSQSVIQDKSRLIRISSHEYVPDFTTRNSELKFPSGIPVMQRLQARLKERGSEIEECSQIYLWLCCREGNVSIPATKINKSRTVVDCVSGIAVTGQESSFDEYTSEQIHQVDCGGLFHVSEQAYIFLKCMHHSSRPPETHAIFDEVVKVSVNINWEEGAQETCYKRLVKSCYNCSVTRGVQNFNGKKANNGVNAFGSFICDIHIV